MDGEGVYSMSLIAAILKGSTVEGTKATTVGEGLKMSVMPSDIVYSDLGNTLAMPNLEDTNLDKIDAIVIAPEAITTEIVENYKSLDEALQGASEAEVLIYEEAGLQKDVINNREALVRTDIDYTSVDSFGRTNLERMEQGLAPLKEGQPIELHHVGQGMDSPLAELTRFEHRSEGNYSVLHETGKESTIIRELFDAERAAHWQTRAEEIRITGGIS